VKVVIANHKVVTLVTQNHSYLYVLSYVSGTAED